MKKDVKTSKPNYKKPRKNPKYKGSNRRANKLDTDSSDAKISDVVNSPMYYVPKDTPELVSNLTNFSFNEFQGVPADLGTIAATPVAYKMSNIMQLEVNPSVPHTEGTQSDGVNMAALKWYTYLSAQNAKSTNYAPQDVALLFLSVGSILQDFSWGARGLGIVKTYNVRNRAYPDLAVKACGFELNDLKGNYAQYKSEYNYLVAKFNKIPIPANIKYFAKCSELYHGLYLDEDGSSMAQSYVLVPRTFWTYDEAYDSNGGGLRTTNPALTLHDPDCGFWICGTFRSYLDHLEAQIDAILNSSLFNYIYSDILRLNQKDGLSLLKLNEIPENYGVLPSKVEEISEWINNAVILGQPLAAHETVVGTDNNDVKSNANGNAIIYRPSFYLNDDLTGFEYLTNWKTDAPTLDSKINSTRLAIQFGQCVASSVTPNAFVASQIAVCDMYVVRINMASDADSGAKVEHLDTPFVDTSTTTGVTIMSIGDMVTKFDWAPYVYFIYPPNHYLNAIFGDFQFYTTIPYDVLRSIDDVGMMSLLEIP